MSFSMKCTFLSHNLFHKPLTLTTIPCLVQLAHLSLLLSPLPILTHPLLQQAVSPQHNLNPNTLTPSPLLLTSSLFPTKPQVLHPNLSCDVQLVPPSHRAALLITFATSLSTLQTIRLQGAHILSLMSSIIPVFLIPIIVSSCLFPLSKNHAVLTKPTNILIGTKPCRPRLRL